MPFNLLIFPLVGGYYALTFCRLFKFQTHRLHSERLLFASVLIGSILTVVALACKLLGQLLNPVWMHKMKVLLRIQESNFGTTVLSLVIAIVMTHALNLFLSKRSQIIIAVQSIGNSLEQLLAEASGRNRPVIITLGNEKVYVGLCEKIPIPDKSYYIEIIPLFSGFRDPETKVLQLNTSYLSVYSEYVKEGKITAISQLNINLVIKTTEISTASIFDSEVFERFADQR